MIRRLLAMCAIVGCHSSTNAPADAGAVGVTDAGPEEAGQDARYWPPAAVLCLPLQDLGDMNLDKALRAIADACSDAQPLLANAARDALALPYASRSVFLLRAARKHPAYQKVCDVSDADATRSWETAKRGPDCDIGKNHIVYMCALQAGTGMFIETIVRAAGSFPDDMNHHEAEEHFAWPPEMIYQLARYELWTYHRCSRNF